MTISSPSLYPLLDTINDPADLRKLDKRDLPALATELRNYIVEAVATTGGHFSSNLGTVELTIAMPSAAEIEVDECAVPKVS